MQKANHWKCKKEAANTKDLVSKGKLMFDQGCLTFYLLTPHISTLAAYLKNVKKKKINKKIVIMA